jgi:pSer/pThr/pTyr-binding forkhead associated (FHA) protein
MQCPNCQHWNEPGSRFCEECGTELTGQNAPASPQVSVRPAAADELPQTPEQDLIPADSPAAASPYTGPRLTLNATGTIFRLGDAVVIGREDATLQIDLDGYPDGKFISHHHAQITKVSDTYYVEDLGSSNHTWVNEKRLAQGQAEPLKEGDVLRLGKLELTFHEG